jgi:AcrR family transcriptional regulator
MIVKDAQLEWVRRPLQARSQQTLDRLLDAAEALLDEQGLDKITVAEVVRRAGSSVGAFYTRFADKEGLVRLVLERFTEQALATTDAVLAPERWQGVPVNDALETMLSFMLGVVRQRRTLIAALTVRSAQDPSFIALGERLRERICECLLALVAVRGDRFTHEDPETGIHLAVGMVLSFMESRAIHQSERISDERAASEMARLIVAYLGVQDAQQVSQIHKSNKTNGNKRARREHRAPSASRENRT